MQWRPDRGKFNWRQQTLRVPCSALTRTTQTTAAKELYALDTVSSSRSPTVTPVTSRRRSPGSSTFARLAAAAVAGIEYEAFTFTTANSSLTSRRGDGYSRSPRVRPRPVSVTAPTTTTTIGPSASSSMRCTSPGAEHSGADWPLRRSLVLFTPKIFTDPRPSASMPSTLTRLGEQDDMVACHEFTGVRVAPWADGAGSGAR